MKVIKLHKNELDLINRATKHDREAQRLLYNMYAPKMLSVCRLYIKDLHHAEDVMLNGFFKVFKYLGSYLGQGSFEGWIRKIMIRESISFIRAKKDLVFSEADVALRQVPYNDVFSEIEVAEIQQVIDELPEGYKIVFVMYAIEGYTHQEIASELKISIGTSKSQLYKARKLLQKELEKLNKVNYGTK
ncbi:RNA polymerase sigma factor [Cognatitamlana onchidii]|uniref:RNA polymerase sigma factor n=1 Tax=Cognatitamlana onchidii TaxID=2562860 RepID=UPI0010A6403C|nr:sigma-70 family RNA polymerase sigma factor [Algibacter onchidii]